MSPPLRRRARLDSPASAPAPAVPLPGGLIAAAPVLLGGRYRLEGQIGEGGMATVHAARDLLLARDVAVKVFRARAASEEALRLQEAEARVLASLNHPSLTTLFDAGVESGDGGPQVYLVMERVAGTDLRSRLREGPLTAAEVALLGFDLAEALDTVHRSGFLHRDVKPANVLLAAARGTRPVVGKLADFGIAAMIGEPDRSEYTVGSAAYLSPEQVEGLDATPASDVYSLGLVLLEALTARTEFPGGVRESAFARLERDPVVPEDVPPAVAEVLRGMTRLLPADRIGLPEVALALQQHLVDDLVARTGRAAIEPREASRVSALRRLDILDSEPDEVFDAITRLASRVLDAPIALVTLIDLDRVWFKSQVGWDEREVGRDVAFCSTTHDGSLVPWMIGDALADSRTAGNALVTAGPEVRAYAGAPLITRDGHRLGAVCVFDKRPREFTTAQLDSLADLAGLALHEIEMRAAARRALFDGR